MAKQQENAPIQQGMETAEDPSWMRPSSPAFWDNWEATAEKSTIYDPPQFKPGWKADNKATLDVACPCLNWWQQRSPLCSQPSPLCCCASFIFCTCVQPSEYLNMLQPDDWMVKFLSSGAHPNCPEEMRGLFWMCDNIFIHEHLITFQDATWTDNGKVGKKRSTYNWTRGNTMFGSLIFAGMNFGGREQRLELSPSGDWCKISGLNGETSDAVWMWLPRPGEVFKTPDDEEFQSEPGEKIRVTYKDPADPKSGLRYQYRMRRIAYLDSNGTLVKTPAYDDLVRRITMPQENVQPCCCGNFVCVSKEARALGNLPYLPATTVVKWAPEHNH